MTSDRGRSSFGPWLVTGLALVLAAGYSGAWAAYQVQASSYLGGTGDDVVRGAAIQSDGTIVLGAEITSASPGNLTPVLLNGATASSTAAIVRLSGDGRTVLSVTRVGDRILDLDIDGEDNVFVALWRGGAMKTNPAATSVLWKKTEAEIGRAMRIDAGTTGKCAILCTSTGTDSSGTGSGGFVGIYDAAGVPTGSLSDGRWKYDVCIDEASGTVVCLGFRNASAWDGSSTQPVQISYVKAVDLSGADKYTLYDWSTDRTSDRFINKPTNNMADTRGYRCAIGRDGKLYCGFECAGGNHIFRYSPVDIMAPATLAGGDKYHQFYDSKSEHKTVIGRYEPGTGAYLTAQQFCARLTTGEANAFRISQGNITADEQGRLSLVAAAGSGGGTSKTDPGLPYTFSPPELSASYGGGGVLIVMSPDLKSRLFCGRISGDNTAWGVDVRTTGGTQQIVAAGSTKDATATYTQNAIQSTSGGGLYDGNFWVVAGDPSVGADSPRHAGPRKLGSAFSVTTGGVTVLLGDARSAVLIDSRGQRVPVLAANAGRVIYSGIAAGCYVLSFAGGRLSVAHRVIVP